MRAFTCSSDAEIEPRAIGSESSIRGIRTHPEFELCASYTVWSDFHGFREVTRVEITEKDQIVTDVSTVWTHFLQIHIVKAGQRGTPLPSTP